MAKGQILSLYPGPQWRLKGMPSPDLAHLIACRRIHRYLAESTTRGLQSELLQDQYEFHAGWRMKRFCASNEQTGSSLPHARERHPCLVPRAVKDFGALPFTGWFFRVALIHMPFQRRFFQESKSLVWQVETSVSVLSIQWFLAGPRTPPQLPSNHAWRDS